MKQKIAIFLLLATILSITGCTANTIIDCNSYCIQKNFTSGKCLSCSGIIDNNNPPECNEEYRSSFFHSAQEREICLANNYAIEDTTAHGCFCK